MKREEIQAIAVSKLVENNYHGTICLSTGTGKTKVAIDCIRNKKSLNVLITSPRTNLKENWKKELEKWGFKYCGNDDILYNYYYEPQDMWLPITITLENIQTCYKWNNSPDEIYFDLIICDEIHTIVTPEYGQLLIRAKELNIPVIGLTATPDNDKLDKKEMYERYCPIRYEYYDSAEDGLINKRKYIVLNHNLTDDDKVITGPKNKKWSAGEKSLYDYLTENIRKGQRLMAATGSEDWFEDAGNWFWKGEGTPEQKNAARVYLMAIKNRKDFLWNLTSTARIAKMINDAILGFNKTDKVLIFSELNTQVAKITPNCVYSKNDEETNKQLLNAFDSGSIRTLGSCHSLTLGLNLVGATHAIMESYSSSDVNLKQRAGRLDRLEVNEHAIIIFIVPVGTQAEEWYIKATKNLYDENSEVYQYSDPIHVINKLRSWEPKEK